MLAVLITAAVIPQNIYAEEETSEAPNVFDAQEWELEHYADGRRVSIKRYNGSKKEVAIPSEILGYKVVSIGNYAFLYKGVTKVTIPEGVTSIGEFAFACCSRLTSVNLPETLTRIDTAAFCDCGLKSVKIPASVKSIGQCAFGYRNVFFGYDDVELDDRMNDKVQNFVIYGNGGSRAESYAKSNEFEFRKKTGWVNKSGKRYYFNNYSAVKGWKKISNKWYWFDSKGVMATGWRMISNKWYYFNSSGVMVKGWQKIKGKWYYFASSGKMLTSWQKISGKWYYLRPSGAMATGWCTIGGKVYYFEPGGAMAENGSRFIDGKTYYFDSNGVCQNP